MADKQRVLDAVHTAIDETNMPLPPERQISKAYETKLLGTDGALDSLGFVNFVLLVEECVEDEFGVAINIADQDAMAREDSPFRTIETLVNYIGERLDTA
ncbi:MAG: hypothetical protein AAFO51_09240 [Pseudomonadota bacterium]